MRVLAVLGYLFGVAAGADAPIRSDEEVIFMPTAAHFDRATNEWIVPVHLWVFEPERDSIRRKWLLRTVVDAMDLDEDELDGQLARDRLAWFIVDNESGKMVTIQVGEQTFTVGPTGSNGHATANLRIPTDEVRTEDGWLVYALAPGQDVLGRPFEGRSQLLAPGGLSVISDIDDTIKVSHVVDRRALIVSTFAEPYEAVEGMAPLYRHWADQGMRFHYLSASPWQLYPAYSAFLEESGFPAGDMTMRHFRLKDRTFTSLLQNPMEYKVNAIATFLEQHPDRRVILVGDSGEADPEVYGRIARRFPDQVVLIAIRQIQEEEHPARFADAFAEVPDEKWILFRDPDKVRDLPFAGTPVPAEDAARDSVGR